MAEKPSHRGMTFGYHRVGVFAALANAVSLVVIALIIGFEAIERLRDPEPASGRLMVVVALTAIVVNVWISVRLHRGAKHDMNIRSAYLHMVGDAVSALGVVLAGVLVLITQSTLADPVVSLMIAALILYSSYDVLRESTTVLLEGTPTSMDMPGVIAAIKGVTGVLDVHDLHVWMVGPGVIACSCHIVVAERSVREGQQVLRAVAHSIEHELASLTRPFRWKSKGARPTTCIAWGCVRWTGWVADKTHRGLVRPHSEHLDRGRSRAGRAGSLSGHPKQRAQHLPQQCRALTEQIEQVLAFDAQRMAGADDASATPDGGPGQCVVDAHDIARFRRHDVSTGDRLQHGASGQYHPDGRRV